MSRPAAFPPVLAAAARRVRPGTCMLCGCTDAFGCAEGCVWEPGTDERVCTAHTDPELRQARAALRAADRKAAHA